LPQKGHFATKGHFAIILLQKGYFAIVLPQKGHFAIVLRHVLPSFAILPLAILTKWQNDQH